MSGRFNTIKMMRVGASLFRIINPGQNPSFSMNNAGGQAVNGDGGNLSECACVRCKGLHLRSARSSCNECLEQKSVCKYTRATDRIRALLPKSNSAYASDLPSDGLFSRVRDALEEHFASPFWLLSHPSTPIEKRFDSSAMVAFAVLLDEFLKTNHREQ